MRDLWVQKFVRKLIVGVAAPGDLAGSIIVEMLNSSEGEDVEQVTRTSKQFSHVCDCSTHLCLYLAYSLLSISLYA